jgi:hypothetical protein
MKRVTLLTALTLTGCAWAGSRSPDYVVRLDLDRIAAQTSARGSSPGFSTVPH